MGSGYVYGKKSQYCLYVHGPDSYKAYKIVSSGKKLNNDQTYGIPVQNCGYWVVSIDKVKLISMGGMYIYEFFLPWELFSFLGYVWNC